MTHTLQKRVAQTWRKEEKKKQYHAPTLSNWGTVVISSLVLRDVNGSFTYFLSAGHVHRHTRAASRIRKRALTEKKIEKGKEKHKTKTPRKKDEFYIAFFPQELVLLAHANLKQLLNYYVHSTS